MAQITTQLFDDEQSLQAALRPKLSAGGLDAVVLFSLGIEAEALAPLAEAAGSAPVLLADTYGILGYSTVRGRNQELMERGRGQEFGGPGGDGGRGVVAVLFGGDGRFVASTEELPGEASAHLAVTTSGGIGFLSRHASAPYYGGVAKAAFCFDPAAGAFRTVPHFFVTALRRPGACTGTTSFTSDPEGSIKRLLQELPPGGSVEAVGLFPCFMRGKNTYGEIDVEPDAVSALLPGVPIYGMFCHGELGPDSCLGFDPDTADGSGCRQHSMTTIIAVHATLS